MTKTAAGAQVSTKLSNKLQKELAEVNTRIVQVTEQRDGARMEIAAKQAKIDRVQAKLEEKEVDIASMDEQLAALQPQCYRLTQQLKASQEDVAPCHKSIGEKDQTIKDFAFWCQPDPSAEQAAIDASMFALD
jgi:chromosome segregation ATPase